MLGGSLCNALFDDSSSGMHRAVPEDVCERLSPDRGINAAISHIYNFTLDGGVKVSRRDEAMTCSYRIQIA